MTSRSRLTGAVATSGDAERRVIVAAVEALRAVGTFNVAAAGATS